MALSKRDRVTIWSLRSSHAVALDGDSYTALLEKVGAEGSYVKMEKDGVFSVASGGDLLNDRACETRYTYLVACVF